MLCFSSTIQCTLLLFLQIANNCLDLVLLIWIRIFPTKLNELFLDQYSVPRRKWDMYILPCEDFAAHLCMRSTGPYLMPFPFVLETAVPRSFRKDMSGILLEVSNANNYIEQCKRTHLARLKTHQGSSKQRLGIGNSRIAEIARVPRGTERVLSRSVHRVLC